MLEEELLVEDIQNLGLPAIVVTRVLEEFAAPAVAVTSLQNVMNTPKLTTSVNVEAFKCQHLFDGSVNWEDIRSLFFSQIISNQAFGSYYHFRLMSSVLHADNAPKPCNYIYECISHLYESDMNKTYQKEYLDISFNTDISKNILFDNSSIDLTNINNYIIKKKEENKITNYIKKNKSKPKKKYPVKKHFDPKDDKFKEP